MRQLQIVLEGLQVAQCSISRIEVDSSDTSTLDISKRILELDFPIAVSSEENLFELRRRICGAQKPVGQAPGDKGGNGTRRIRIHVTSHRITGDEFLRGLRTVNGEYRIRINIQRASEVRAALQIDGTRQGEIWRDTQNGFSPHQIAERLGTQTSNFVMKYMRFALALETGDIPTAPTMIRECSNAMRGFLKRHEEIISTEIVEIIEADIKKISALMDNPETIDIEDSQFRKQAEIAEKENVPGVYVYSLPHYINFPIYKSDDEALSDRTLMKVGYSKKDAMKRFIRQQRTTEIPEQPRLLRIYTGDSEMLKSEQKFHALLSAADHRRNSAKVAGTEWFLTSLKFLDEIANTLDLTVHWTPDEITSDE